MTIFYSGMGVNVAPCQNVDCDSLSPTYRTDLAGWYRSGVRKARMIVTSEAFTGNPQRVFDGAIAPWVEACLSLKVQPTVCLYSSSEMGWRDRLLAQTNAGRVELAERSAMLVRLGWLRFSAGLRYDLSNETLNWNPDPADADNPNAALRMDHLNALQVCYARKVATTAHLTLSCPVWASPDQAPSMTYFGDQYTSIGTDFYMHPELTCDKWPDEGDVTAAAIERLRPFAETIKRMGTTGVIREWGNADLRIRNDQVTTRMLLGQLAAVKYFGLQASAFAWMGPYIAPGGKPIPLAPATATS